MKNANRYEILATDVAEEYMNLHSGYNLMTKTTSDGKKVCVRILQGCPCSNSCQSYAEDRISKREGIVKKYQEQVKKSHGFDIRDYPGFIPNVTNIVPRQEVIYNRKQHPKDYDNIMDMAALAIKVYNEKHQDRKFKLAEIKKLNVEEGCLAGKTYYITLSAVNVEHEKESDFFHKLATSSQIIITACLYWSCLLSSLPWKKSLGAKLTKLKVPQNLKASKQELSDKTAICKTFRAKVRDDINMMRKVLFCKAT